MSVTLYLTMHSSILSVNLSCTNIDCDKLTYNNYLPSVYSVLYGVRWKGHKGVEYLFTLVENGLPFMLVTIEVLSDM